MLSKGTIFPREPFIPVSVWELFGHLLSLVRKHLGHGGCKGFLLYNYNEEFSVHQAIFAAQSVKTAQPARQMGWGEVVDRRG